MIISFDLNKMFVYPIDREPYVAENEYVSQNEFKRLFRVPSLSADHPDYYDRGDY